MQPPVFSIVTPTFNSSKFIHRVYESAASQTFRQFEWIVIDDASQDDTLDILHGYKRAANFPITIIAKPENRGLLDSYNAGINAARGEFFVGMGHDDGFKANSLQFFYDRWNELPQSERHCFCGLTVQCCDEMGVVAENFPVDGMDSNFLEMYFIHKRRAEQWSIFRMDVLRQFHFPEQYRMGEGAFVWFPMGERYQSRYFNMPLRIYHRDNPASLTNNQDAGKYAVEMAEIYRTMFEYTTRYASRDLVTLSLHGASYLRYSWHLGQTFTQAWRRVHGTWRWLAVLSAPVAMVMLLLDRIRLRRS